MRMWTRVDELGCLDPYTGQEVLSNLLLVSRIRRSGVSKAESLERAPGLQPGHMDPKSDSAFLMVRLTCGSYRSRRTLPTSGSAAPLGGSFAGSWSFSTSPGGVCPGAGLCSHPGAWDSALTSGVWPGCHTPFTLWVLTVP